MHQQVRDSIVVSISACHAEDPGAIPGRGVSVHHSNTSFEGAGRGWGGCGVPFLSFSFLPFSFPFPARVCVRVRVRVPLISSA